MEYMKKKDAYQVLDMSYAAACKKRKKELDITAFADGFAAGQKFITDQIDQKEKHDQIFFMRR